MTNPKTNLIKGQSERSFQKSYTTPTSFTPRPIYKSIDISNSTDSHNGAKLFFANLRKTCKNSR